MPISTTDKGMGRIAFAAPGAVSPSLPKRAAHARAVPQANNRRVGRPIAYPTG
jgi:hypothetical protein